MREVKGRLRLKIKNKRRAWPLLSMKCGFIGVIAKFALISRVNHALCAVLHRHKVLCRHKLAAICPFDK